MRALIVLLVLLRSLSASAAPDNDGDGVRDDVDKCPTDPEDKDGFEDSDGCPDFDNDGDGIRDASDKCPNQSEDKDGYQDSDGCPDPDNDADGILDAVDRCPIEAEDKDGFEDSDGCPDPDNDGDGVLDASDKCPTSAESRNGYQDDDGCPDALPKALVGRTTPHPDYADWKPPAGAVAPKPAATVVKPEIPKQDHTPKTIAPTGYRCGPGGKLVLNKGCTCAADRTERRDGDGVSVCVKKTGVGEVPRTEPVPAARAFLNLDSRPSSSVALDGSPLGQTPKSKVSVAPGAHKVQFTRGATTETRTATVKAGETTTISVTFSDPKPVVGDCPSWKGSFVQALQANDYACARTILLPRLNSGTLDAGSAHHLKIACLGLSDSACVERVLTVERALTPTGTAPTPNPPSGVDSDGDGIPDSKDQCPTQPENKNFVRDTDGCPD